MPRHISPHSILVNISSSIPEQINAQTTIELVLGQMKILHRESGTEETDAERILAGMMEQFIGPTTRKACEALIEIATREYEESCAKKSITLSDMQEGTVDIKRSIVSAMFREHWFESTLSTLECPIPSATYGKSKLIYDLRLLIADNPSPEDLQKIGWIMFDVDALRPFKDLKGHEQTTALLREIVKILMHPDGPTRSKMRERGIEIVAMASGGDEFELYVHGKQPLQQHVIDDIVASFQSEISTSQTIRAMLNFDDPETIKQFGLSKKKKRKEFEKLDEAGQANTLQEIRARLPETFIPWISGGGCLLTQGIERAAENDANDLCGNHETFTTLRQKIVEAMFSLAEESQGIHKRLRREYLKLHDPRQYEFGLRNGENRNLADTIEKLNEEILELRRQLSETLKIGPTLRRIIGICTKDTRKALLNIFKKKAA